MKLAYSFAASGEGPNIPFLSRLAFASAASYWPSALPAQPLRISQSAMSSPSSVQCVVIFTGCEGTSQETARPRIQARKAVRATMPQGHVGRSSSAQVRSGGVTSMPASRSWRRAGRRAPS